MIVELFGLPASGKSTYARSFEREGGVRVREFSPKQILFENLLFAARYPALTLRLLYALRYAPSGLLRYSFVNLVLVHNAKWMRARRISRTGRVAVIDQGHHQNLLSLFRNVPPEPFMYSYARTLPKPDLLIVCEPGQEVRRMRLEARGAPPRSELGHVEAERFARVAEDMFPQAVSVLERSGLRMWRIANEPLVLSDLTAPVLSYATSARMPTEKAHGISIAHMCAAFSRNGIRTELAIPSRRNRVVGNVFSYYDLPRTFFVRTVPTWDFIGRGLTKPFFFFLQRLLFLFALTRVGVPSGVVYTREPEISWYFSKTHTSIFEAHDWPQGIKGRIVAFLVRRAALIVCNSEGTAEAARARGLTRTLVAPNGFDPKPFERAESKENARTRLGIPQGALVALYAGALDERKGVQTLLESAKHMEGTLVTVIGGSEGEVQRLSEQYPAVRFLGFRPYRELANNLVAADVLVLPNSASSQESARFTSPIKMFAYMASGVPIVASDVPSARAFLNEENATLVAPDDPPALARAIEFVVSGKDLVRAKSVRARNEVRAFSWDARADKVYAAIRATICP